MRKWLASSLLIAMLLGPLLLVSPVFADSIRIPFGHEDTGIKLPNIEVVPSDVPEGTSAGVVGFRRLLSTVSDLLTLILGPVALIILFVAAYQLITAQAQASEEMQKQKLNVAYLLLGLVIFALSSNFVYNFLFISEGEFLLEETAAVEVASAAVVRIKQLLNIFLSFSGAGAIFMLVVASLRLIVNPGTEEVIEKQKKIVGYTIVGIIIISLSETMINDIVFPNAGYQGVQVEAFERQLQGLSNFLLGFLGIIIFVTFVISGVILVIHYGNEDVLGKVKTTLKNVLIGALVSS